APAGAAPARAEPRHGSRRTRPAPTAGPPGARALWRRAGRAARRGSRTADLGIHPGRLAQSHRDRALGLAAGALGSARWPLAATVLADTRPGTGQPAPHATGSRGGQRLAVALSGSLRPLAGKLARRC